MLSYAFHTYRITIKTSMGATLYFLVYEMEAMMPFKVEIPSLKVLMDAELEKLEWEKLKF